MVVTTNYGTGRKTLVVHGGPGFSSEHLIAPLLKLTSRTTFVFYDQSYSEPTLEGCADEVLNVIEEQFPDDTVRVVAHSWGCLVLFSALAKLRAAPQLAKKKYKLLLINPVPISSGLFHESVVSFQQRIPASEIEEAMRLALSNPTGVEAMAKLLPYYVSNRQVCETLKIPLSLSAYQAVLSSLGDFDFNSVLANLEMVSVMLGEDDITPRHTIQNILDIASEVETVPMAGHFPLHEQPDAALQILAKWIS
jgi:pimeloyl-ACP methyl ester carboxylesterase